MPPLNIPTLSLQPPPNWSQGVLNSAILAAFPPPSAGNSWLDYQCGTWIEADSGAMIGVTLPTDPLIPGQSATATTWDALNSSTLPTGFQQGSPFPPLADVIDQAQTEGNGGFVSEVFAQQRSSPILYVFLIGHAVRIGFPIPMPSIVSISGAKPVLCNRPDMGEGFGQRVIGQNVAPVYGAAWKLRYAVVGTFPTSSIPVPPNPGLA